MRHLRFRTKSVLGWIDLLSRLAPRLERLISCSTRSATKPILWRIGKEQNEGHVHTSNANARKHACELTRLKHQVFESAHTLVLRLTAFAFQSCEPRQRKRKYKCTMKNWIFLRHVGMQDTQMLRVFHCARICIYLRCTCEHLLCFPLLSLFASL